MEPSAAILKQVYRIERQINALSKMQGICGADHCTLIVLKAHLATIRDRHRTKLGFIPEGGTHARISPTS
ncbi:hypothetical protein [Desulfovibrio subterraneus]|jgi:hypothetical protein|uniref:Uncharacterized protein n=1 Tax=Desulfovibrio subterraneus TaxID=2718620 RepID=A0A7J0BI71_9BACT|nr:hypothetical protein [Desulfovibrio subterraneus]GFM33258.1 hypothetical protein DSM101010T_16230 [Desulfovibrio subterraneus]